MGADLLLTYCEVPSVRRVSESDTPGLRRVTGEQVQRIWDWSTGDPPQLTPLGKFVRDEFEKRLRATSEDHLDGTYEEAMGQSFAEADIETLEEKVEYFLSAFDDVTLGGRDIAVMNVADRLYYFTGGMSWGDNPTDSYDKVNVLGLSGLLDVPFGFDPMTHTAGAPIVNPPDSQAVND